MSARPIQTGDMVIIVAACCQQETAIGTPFTVGQMFNTNEVITCCDCGHCMTGAFAQYNKTDLYYPVGWLKRIGDGLPAERKPVAIDEAAPITKEAWEQLA